jgi:hypothetical protein
MCVHLAQVRGELHVVSTRQIESGLHCNGADEMAMQVGLGDAPGELGKAR